MKKQTLSFIFILSLTSISFAQDVIYEPERQFGIGTLSDAQFHPDGQHVLTAGGNGVFLWDITTGEMTNHIITPCVLGVSLSPDGNTLLTNRRSIENILGGENILWDIERGIALATLETEYPASGVFTPDGQQIVLLQGDWIEIWIFLQQRNSEQYKLMTKE